MTGNKRLMKASDIPAFVVTLIKACCDICAVGDTRYVLGDVEETLAAHDELECIGEAFEDRDSLIRESVAYLRSIGRYLDPGSPPTHWSENEKWHTREHGGGFILGTKPRLPRQRADRSTIAVTALSGLSQHGELDMQPVSRPC
ncbi:hypothetical protein [Mesorhizobium silamurunense]|uniref:hypothetical protein n=1 Tax=Mesorhizobium silamurunense TaxID=499528 RepID=UPI0028B2618E|nr:hypothetical protein [Mesorhizobium silamurunense]